MPNRTKILSYRVQGSSTLEAQAAGWAGFEFSGGPWIVKYAGPWGQIQGWFSSESEGRRVIEHACGLANIDPDDPQGTWSVAVDSSGRRDTVRTFRTAIRQGCPCVTMRQGSDGWPEVTTG